MLSGTSTFGTVQLTPMLMFETVNGQSELRPVKTIPSHFSQVHEATSYDFQMVFGSEENPDKKTFTSGCPRHGRAGLS